jgi:hypothetical protein
MNILSLIKSFINILIDLRNNLIIKKLLLNAIIIINN